MNAAARSLGERLVHPARSMAVIPVAAILATTRAAAEALPARLTMSPTTDFSYDFQHLVLKPVARR